jgi:hypothetical protein
LILKAIKTTRVNGNSFSAPALRANKLIKERMNLFKGFEIPLLFETLEKNKIYEINFTSNENYPLASQLSISLIIEHLCKSKEIDTCNLKGVKLSEENLQLLRTKSVNKLLKQTITLSSPLLNSTETTKLARTLPPHIRIVKQVPFNSECLDKPLTSEEQELRFRENCSVSYSFITSGSFKSTDEMAHQMIYEKMGPVFSDYLRQAEKINSNTTHIEHTCINNSRNLYLQTIQKAFNAAFKILLHAKTLFLIDRHSNDK